MRRFQDGNSDPLLREMVASVDTTSTGFSKRTMLSSSKYRPQMAILLFQGESRIQGLASCVALIP